MLPLSCLFTQRTQMYSNNNDNTKYSRHIFFSLSLNNLLQQKKVLFALQSQGHATISISLTSESLSELRTSWPVTLRCAAGDPNIGLASRGSMQWLISTLCWWDDDNKGSVWLRSSVCEVCTLWWWWWWWWWLEWCWLRLVLDGLLLLLWLDEWDEDEGEWGALNKLCDNIGSPFTGCSSSMKSSIGWRKPMFAASLTTSGICAKEKY